MPTVVVAKPKTPGMVTHGITPINICGSSQYLSANRMMQKTLVLIMRSDGVIWCEVKFQSLRKNTAFRWSP